MTIFDLKTGQSAKLVDFSENTELKLKFLSMGLLKGDEIKILSRSPFGGPIAIRHGHGTSFGLRKNEARSVVVEPFQS